jgi:hypothetical protein
MKSLYNFFRRCYFDFFIHGGWKPNTWPNGIRMAILRNKHRLILLLGGYVESPNTTQNVSFKGVFNYGEITEGQKSIVEELLTTLQQNPKVSFVLDDEYISLIKKQFKIEEIERFDIEKSAFWQFAKQRNFHTPIQGWIKVGIGPEAKEYPIISINMDIREYDKMMCDMIKIGKDNARNI